MTKKVVNFFIRGGVSKEEYALIRPLMWRRNRRILKITSLLATIMGLLFLLYTLLISKEDTWLPYLILFLGSAFIFTFAFIKVIPEKSIYLNSFLCYGQLTLLWTYSILLSVAPSNYEMPATSVVAFIALLPLSTDDRPFRMYIFMIFESALYLTFSYFFKSPHAFGLDMMNVLTFLVIAMLLYGVICMRNTKEISTSMKIEKIQKGTVAALATVVEERDEDTGGHIVRSGDYVYRLIGKMKKHEKFSDISGDYFRNVVLAAPLHDIGKIKIPDTILNKPGKLTPEEYEIIKKHANYGANIIKKTIYSVENKEYSDVAFNIAKYHHERYDGTGYPDRLKGEEIPLEARIMSLADVYDALISDRVYKKAYSKEQSINIILEGRGTQFDPLLTDLFVEAVKEID